MNERSIFIAALEKDDPSGQAAYLDQACGADVALRQRVERLLQAHRAAGGILDRPAAPGPLTEAYRPISEGPGTLIGPYKLLQQIGEGGFGVVFMAEQEKPVRRMVALKIIKPGMDTAQVIARFESERQALAIMDHPNIARVLDAGATESGRPYFVMELVKGVPITEFCDQNHLPPEARLKLFIDVCHAIQHAHHKGVIHRDVKPSNVMVTLHDGVPVVKVIDFGVAKATVQKLTEKTLFTAYGQMIGTPAYMSPEQAEMSGLDIDTRSDIYSLGVLLYELLTGTTPLESKRLREAGYAEMQRLIREEEPPRPSTRLSSLGDSATVFAGNRGTDVKRLVQFLRSDIDWIVMKALDKDRNRRYATPGNFAEDIERYLRHDAILARPPSTAYKLKKFARRNRAAVLTAAAVAAALLLGIAVATWQAVVATRAKQEALDALHDKEAARAAEAEQRRLAQANEQRARKQDAETQAVLNFVEEKIFAAARPEGQAGGLGREVLLRKAIEAALPFVDKAFTNQPLIEARLRMTLGNSFLFLGETKIAAEQFQKAHDLAAKHLGPYHPNTLGAMNNLIASYNHLGRHGEALKLCEETLAICKAQLGPDDPKTIESMFILGSCYHYLGRHSDGLKVDEETLVLCKAKHGPEHHNTIGIMNNLANRYAALSRHAEALKLRQETLALYKTKLGPDHPDTFMAMSNLANSYAALGRDADAIKLKEETLALMRVKLGPDHLDTLTGMSNLAWSLVSASDVKFRDPQRAVELATKAVAGSPSRPSFRGTLGAARYRSGDCKGAIAELEKTISLRNADDSRNASAAFFLAMAHGQLGEKDKARAWFDKAVQWMEKGKTDDPDLKRFRAEAAELLGVEMK